MKATNSVWLVIYIDVTFGRLCSFYVIWNCLKQRVHVVSAWKPLSKPQLTGTSDVLYFCNESDSYIAFQFCSYLVKLMLYMTVVATTLTGRMSELTTVNCLCGFAACGIFRCKLPLCIRHNASSLQLFCGFAAVGIYNCKFSLWIRCSAKYSESSW